MHQSHQHIQKGLNYAFWLNLSFAIIELFGGWYTHSTAIITDAFHDFMDAAAIGIAVMMEKIANKEPDDKYTWGYQKYSILSAIILSAILLIGSVAMFLKAIGSFEESYSPNSLGMFILALLGISINGLAFYKIKQSDTTSSSDPKHIHNYEHHNHHESHHDHQNSKAVMLHLLEDVLGWVAVLIGAVIIYFTNWYWIDALLTLGISVFIAYNAIRNLKQSFFILLDKVPAHIDVPSIRLQISNHENIVQIRQLRIWTRDGNTTYALVSVFIQRNVDSFLIVKELKSILHNYGIEQSFVEINY